MLHVHTRALPMTAIATSIIRHAVTNTVKRCFLQSIIIKVVVIAGIRKIFEIKHKVPADNNNPKNIPYRIMVNFGRSDEILVNCNVNKIQIAKAGTKNIICNIKNSDDWDNKRKYAE